MSTKIKKSPKSKKVSTSKKSPKGKKSTHGELSLYSDKKKYYYYKKLLVMGIDKDEIYTEKDSKAKKNVDGYLNYIVPIIFKGYAKSICNAIRRIPMDMMTTYSIDPGKCEIDYNRTKTIYHGDYMSKRLSLIPIYQKSLESYDDKSKLKFVLEYDNDTDENVDIYVYEHLQVSYDGSSTMDGKKVDIKKLILYNMLILTLKPKEKIHIECGISDGIGIENPRYNGAISMYKYWNDKDNTTIRENNKDELNYNKNDDGSPEYTIISIETNGKLDPITTFRKIFDVIMNELDTIFDKHYVIEVDSAIKELLTITVDNMDYTIGNIILEYMLKMVKSDNSMNLHETKITMKDKHPTMHSVIYEIRLPDLYVVNLENTARDTTVGSIVDKYGSDVSDHNSVIFMQIAIKNAKDDVDDIIKNFNNLIK